VRKGRRKRGMLPECMRSKVKDKRDVEGDLKDGIDLKFIKLRRI